MSDSLPIEVHVGGELQARVRNYYTAAAICSTFGDGTTVKKYGHEIYVEGEDGNAYESADRAVDTMVDNLMDTVE